MIALLALLVAVSSNGYILTAPEGHNYWFVAVDAGYASSLYAFHDLPEKDIIDKHVKAGDLVQYSRGDHTELIETKEGISRVRLEDGTEGWVSSVLLIPTPETQRALNEKAAKEKHDEALAEAEFKAELDREHSRREALCRETFKMTIDKRVSDLTIRELAQVRACQDVGLYK